MLIEIDDSYIEWVKNQDPEATELQIAEYINEVLMNHCRSWDDLSE